MNYDNVKAHIHPKSAAQRQRTLPYGQIGTQMHCKCVPICDNLLQIGTQLQCKCVPICNNLLQIGTQLHHICVPICKNVLQIGTLLQIGTRQRNIRGI